MRLQEILRDTGSSQPTLLILLLLSAVRNDMLLISFITTKFCSSRLKFYKTKKDACGRCNKLQHVRKSRTLTWDLDQKIKTSPTIRNNSSASGSGHVNHLALYSNNNNRPRKFQMVASNGIQMDFTCCCRYIGWAEGRVHTGLCREPQTHRE